MTPMQRFARSTWATALLLAFLAPVSRAREPDQAVIPHAQDKPPNEPRDARTAAAMMTVPPGFSVEVVACEPDVVNPVAMAIDERGRFWITESLEYPRRDAGVGRDRVKVLADTDGDGRCDTVSIFLDGLNIPSGVAVGHGGVWIANAPDILFVPDADRDGVPDGPAQVVVTGFGRTDTHELPNSLTWGPDGWLYGLNGVFNHSHVRYPRGNPNFTDDHPGWPLTCAMFRIHPRTREFQVFCEGTSNPWGIAFDVEGEAFVSACVIDHLWHLVETGYYHRQGGPYPPFTWKIDSIVAHKHQKAAYCGIHYFDSDAYPETYRGRLYMGNIHGGCINVDRIERKGSTYRGFGEADFLTANDAWFMPVVQKTGPDGCLYILDWYDRYHCYQDANRDPTGIDRLKGRLYRVRYGDSPRAPRGLDLATESDERLIERLGEGNDWTRWTATRLLQERSSRTAEDAALAVLSRATAPRPAQFHAAWVLAGHADRRDTAWLRQLDTHEEPVLRAWGVRLRGADPRSHQDVLDRSASWAESPSPEVRLQAAIAIAKAGNAVSRHGLAPGHDPRFRPLLSVLASAGDDTLIPRVVWRNLHPLLESDPDGFVAALSDLGDPLPRPVVDLLPRAVDRLLARAAFDAAPIGAVFERLRGDHERACRDVLAVIAAKAQSGELKGDRRASLVREMSPRLRAVLDGPADAPLHLDAAFLATALGDAAGFAAASRAVETASLSDDQRLAALNALVAAGQDGVVASVARIFEQRPPASSELKARLLAGLAPIDDPEVGRLALRFYPEMEPDLQPKAVELLTQRAGWAKQLLGAIEEKRIDARVINVNQARRLKQLGDEDLSRSLATQWGQVRDGRDPDRERYIADMKSLIRASPGDPLAGEKVFARVCAQCHKMYGAGAEVGPDITRNGRNDFTQLVSNVFDPNLVIGAGYLSCTVVTNGGRAITGLLAEDGPQRVVLRIPGGKQEVIARSDIDDMKVGDVSLMPEQLEKQLSRQELIDLFAFITLDRHPSDPSAKRLPGVSQVVPRQSSDPADFPALVAEILPGFSTNESGERGIGLLAEHLGRDNVLRTHPVGRDKPCTLTMKFVPPADRKTTLILDVAHDPRGDWRLVVRGNGERLADEMISGKTCLRGWRTIVVDLSKFAGRELTLGLVNQANDWSHEFGYWGGARIVSE